MKIAIVHDWLITFGGAERTLEQILQCYPYADVFTLIDFLPERDRGFLRGKKIYTSFLQKIPTIKTSYRKFLLLMPIAIEQFDFSGYDLIISSCHAISKGVITGPDQLHICYCYTPIRYAWDLQFQYLRESNLETGIKSTIARIVLHWIRLWDVRSEKGVDNFIAISHFISRRIRKVYRRNSEVIYPPVNTVDFFYSADKQDYYLTSSRLVPYKKVNLIVEAFSQMPDKKLVVIGDGPDFDKCKQLATKNVELLGWQPQDTLIKHMQQAKAFIYAAEEDFGIAPIEAQSCGTPVICFGKGALSETIKGFSSSSPTGVFFNKQSVDSIAEAVLLYEDNIYLFNNNECRKNALRFSSDVFRVKFSEFVNTLYVEHKNKIIGNF